MKNYLWLLGIVLFFSCESKKETTGNFADVEIQNLNNFLQNNAADLVVIDVRTPKEIKEGKIVENALELDFYNNSFEDKLSALDKSKNYLVYCRSGGRSGKTVGKMQKMGFKSAHNLSGGYSAWIAK